MAQYLLCRHRGMVAAFCLGRLNNIYYWRCARIRILSLSQYFLLRSLLAFLTRSEFIHVDYFWRCSSYMAVLPSTVGWGFIADKRRGIGRMPFAPMPAMSRRISRASLHQDPGDSYFAWCCQHGMWIGYPHEIVFRIAVLGALSRNRAAWQPWIFHILIDS